MSSTQKSPAITRGVDELIDYIIQTAYEERSWETKVFLRRIHNTVLRSLGDDAHEEICIIYFRLAKLLLSKKTITPSYIITAVRHVERWMKN